MGQVVELIRLLWVSVAAYLGIKGAMIASLNLLGLVIMVSYLLVKDVQDTLLKVGGWLVELLLLRLPALIWPRLRTGPRPTRYL
ncbi:MAG TPA: hypothetical protein VM537_25110, partial [Anaerolineae bacterium]|nr:hypothetical protein [Anaerolineae bacterium]